MCQVSPGPARHPMCQSSLFFLRLVLFLFASSAVALDPNCTRTCGGMAIPFPFGITPGCGLPAFQLNCSATSKASPSMQFDGTGEAGSLFPFVDTGSGLFQVLNITPVSIIINVTDLKAVFCDGARVIATFVLDPYSPFVLSGNNKFFVTGCNSTGEVTTDLSLGTTGRCNTSVSNCYGTHTGNVPCNSQECCIALPAGTRQVVMRGSGYSHDSRGCGFATSFFSTANDASGAGQLGLELAYFVQGSCGARHTPSICSGNATCSDVQNVDGYVCICDRSGYEGDGYLDGSGCSDVDECVLDSCAVDAECINNDGGFECYCVMGYHGDAYKNGTGCAVVNNRHVNGAAAAIAASLAVLVVVALLLALFGCWFYKRREPSLTEIVPGSVKSGGATTNF